jgi:hypothetical protein
MQNRLSISNDNYGKLVWVNKRCLLNYLILKNIMNKEINRLVSLGMVLFGLAPMIQAQQRGNTNAKIIVEVNKASPQQAAGY